MPKTIGFRVVQIPEAQLLNDLFGIDLDLQSAAEFCALLQEAWDKEIPEVRLIDPLSTAAVVRYSRCFEGGVRTKLTVDDVAAVDASWCDFHQAMFYLRQKHIVHSVNEFEENLVRIAVVEPPSPPQIQKIGMQAGRMTGLSRDAATSLRQLALALCENLKLRIEVETQRIQAIVDQMKIEDVYALPMPEAFAPSWSRVGDSRGKTRS